MEYYVIVLLVYWGTDLIAAWGLNLEFGVAGVANLGYIALVAVGAYTYSVLTLGPSSGNGAFQEYILGLRLPAIAAIAIAMAAAAAVGCMIGLTGLRRIRQDYQALVALAVAILAVTVVGAEPRLFNGDAGLALVPSPIVASDSWGYVVMVGVCCLGVYLLLRRFTGGPLGRALRAMRDNEEAAVAVGKNVFALRIMVQGVGGALAGLSGALLVGFIGAWSPSAWQWIETLVLLTAIIVGGVANDAGVLVGTAVVPVLLVQGVQFLPNIPGAPGLSSYLSVILLSMMTIAFLFFRPQGLIPERRPRSTGSARDVTVDAEAVGGLTSTVTTRRTRVSAEGAFTEIADRVAARPMPDSRPSVLEVDNVSRNFGGVQAVRGASFNVAAGAITGLIGPNGAGKSTMIGLISGLIPPSHGTIAFQGERLGDAPAYRRARLGIVRTFQLSHEFGRLTTLENLLVAAPRQRGESLPGTLFGRRYWRDEERGLVEQAMALLRAFGVDDKATDLARTLSGGQKRLLEVMRALMVRPKLLLLDEPTAGLSPMLIERLEQVLTEQVERGLSVLLVEHELGVVERLCANVVVMADGGVLAQGTMAALRDERAVQDAYLVG